MKNVMLWADAGQIGIGYRPPHGRGLKIVVGDK